jgi:thiamine-phosphate pyrophosphorylase
MSLIYGLYAVTPEIENTDRLAAMVREALRGGARLVQYRSKTAPAPLRREQARALLGLCREHGVPLIVNDDIGLAADVGADGVHLGREDAPVAAARLRLGEGKIVGVSCYDEIERALRAQADGAAYVAFGSFFASRVKPGAVRAPTTLLSEAKRRLAVPVVAIGGITIANAPQLIAAGADSIAVITALFSAPDIRNAAAQFSALFNRQGHSDQRI